MVLLLSWGQCWSPLLAVRAILTLVSARTCVPSRPVGVPEPQDRGATPRPTGTTPVFNVGAGVRVSGQSASLRATDNNTGSLLTSLTLGLFRAGLLLNNPGVNLGNPFRSGQLTVRPSSFFRSWPVAIAPVSWGVRVEWAPFPPVWVNTPLPQLPSADGLSRFTDPPLSGRRSSLDFIKTCFSPLVMDAVLVLCRLLIFCSFLQCSFVPLIFAVFFVSKLFAMLVGLSCRCCGRGIRLGLCCSLSFRGAWRVF